MGAAECLQVLIQRWKLQPLLLDLLHLPLKLRLVDLRNSLKESVIFSLEKSLMLFLLLLLPANCSQSSSVKPTRNALTHISTTASLSWTWQDWRMVFLATLWRVFRKEVILETIPKSRIQRN